MKKVVIVRRRKIDGGDLVVMNGGHIVRELRWETWSGGLYGHWEKFRWKKPITLGHY